MRAGEADDEGRDQRVEGQLAFAGHFADEADEDEGNEDDREDARVAQALFLQIGGVPGLVHLAAGELAQAGLNDAVVDDGAHALTVHDHGVHHVGHVDEEGFA